MTDDKYSQVFEDIMALRDRLGEPPPIFQKINSATLSINELNEIMKKMEEQYKLPLALLEKGLISISTAFAPTDYGSEFISWKDITDVYFYYGDAKYSVATSEEQSSGEGEASKTE